MTAMLNIQLELVGANAGKTIDLNNLHFEKGSCIVSGTAESVAHAINYYRMFWAFPKASPEYEDAKARYEQSLKEANNGVSDSTKAAKSGTAESVPGALQSDGSGIADVSALRGSGDASGPRGDTGSSADGSGRQDAGLPDEPSVPDASSPEQASAVDTQQLLGTNQPLIAAILNLDPENDAHWNPDGQPMVSVVGQAFGSEALTRREIDEAIPGWTRDAAREESLRTLTG